MLKEYFQTKIKIRPGYILTALFLFFIFSVGLAALPQLFINAGKTMQRNSGVQNFIKQTNDQYEQMLEEGKNTYALHSKDTYINLNGLLAGKLRQPFLNDRILMKNGHLGHVVSQTPEPEAIRNAADHIIAFYKEHTAAGGDFLFVMFPSQISKYEDYLPTGYTDTTNATADAFLSLLGQAGVPYMDLREHMQAEGMSVTDHFYVTDHHWKPQTGFWAYSKMLAGLAEMQIISPVDSFYTDPDNYTFVTYENTFLGSSGKRTGIYYAGLDDSILIQPNFETQIAISVPERGLELRGRYEEVCYNTEAEHNFEDPDFFLENCYGLYGWGDTPITHWRNDQAPVTGRFLLIGESFGNIPFSLMSIVFSSCDEIDLRYFEEDFTGYYNNYRPETVIMALNVDNTISEFTHYSFFE